MLRRAARLAAAPLHGSAPQRRFSPRCEMLWHKRRGTAGKGLRNPSSVESHHRKYSQARLICFLTSSALLFTRSFEIPPVTQPSPPLRATRLPGCGVLQPPHSTRRFNDVSTSTALNYWEERRGIITYFCLSPSTSLEDETSSFNGLWREPGPARLRREGRWLHW